MWLFKKKQKIKEIVVGRFSVGDEVAIIQKDFTSIPGTVYRLSKDEQGNVLYEVNVGGECPYIKKGLREEDLKSR